MSSGLYSGVSGLALGTGLYRNVSGLWSGASGLINGFGGGGPFPGASLYLDFLTPPLDSRITFSRGTNATLVDSTGKITYAPANLLLQSQTFDNASWAKNLSGSASAPVVTADFGVAPDGTTTADRAQLALNGGTTTGDRALVSQSVTLAVGVNYVFSIWLRSLGASVSMGIGCDNLTGNTPITVTSEWQRFTFSGTASGTGGLAYFQLRGGQTPTQANTADVLAWGAQLEPVTYQTTPGPYVATTASAYYGPRFDYDPVTLAPRGLLIEEARTNLLLRSEEFNSAPWTANNITVTANNTASPDGTTSADLILETTATAEHSVYNGNVTTSAGAVTASVFVKASGRNWIAIRETLADGTTFVNTFFNIATGTVGTVAAGRTATITNYNNGWYRCTVTATSTGGSRFVGVNLSTDGSTISYTGVATLGAWVWGAQLEAGAFATSYIPTVASTVSRSADVATMTGTNFSSWYNQSEGTLVVDFSSNGINTVSSSLAAISDGTGNNILLPFINSGGISFVSVLSGGATSASLNTGAVAVRTVSKHATAYQVNNFAATLNGAAPTVDTLGPVPVSANVMNIGWAAPYGGLYLNGHIRAIAYYNTRLPNTQLQTLTAPSLASPLALDFISPTYTVGY